MTIGVLSEAAQIPGPRDAEIMDLIIDATGIFGALSVVAIFDVAIRAQLTANQRWIMALLSMLAMTATISPTLWYAYALTARHQALPSLLSFEHAWERVNISQSSHRRVELIASPKDWPTSGQRVAQVAESRRRGDLLSLHPYPNWLDYTSVSFLAASTTETTHQVRVTIRDMRPNQESHSNRFKTSILVGPQPVRYTIRLDDIRDTSVDRIFDLAHIDSIILRASNPGDDVKVLVDDFRLEL